MSDEILEYIRAHVTEWPKGQNTVRLDTDGEIPSVGMEYLDEDGQLCKCLTNYDGFVIGEMLEHARCHNYPVISQARLDLIKPIDTRTDKEKADDLFKICLKGEQTSTHKTFSQAVVDGDFGDNIKWVK